MLIDTETKTRLLFCAQPGTAVCSFLHCRFIWHVY